jgi:hypothetical protein
MGVPSMTTGHFGNVFQIVVYGVDVIDLVGMLVDVVIEKE